MFKYDLGTALGHLGFEGVFHMKGTEVAEGLALFYNTARFILLDSQKLLFSEEIPRNPVFADIWDRIKENPKLSARMLARTTALQVNVLGALESDELLVVANTHLYFHPDADHIRLLHGCLAIRYLQHVVTKVKERVSFTDSFMVSLMGFINTQKTRNNDGIIECFFSIQVNECL